MEQGQLNTRLEAIVLAGGRSSRMGRDKALLPIQGVPLLQLVCGVANKLCHTVYVVTPWPERYQDLLPVTCQFIREIPLSEEIAGEVTLQEVESSISSHALTSSGPHPLPLPQGPLVGFARGLARVRTEWVLLLACDLPRLRVEVLQEWTNGLDGVAEEAIALLPRNAKGWEPLCGFYRRSCLPDLTSFIDRGGRSFQQWLTQHSVQLLSLPEADQMLFNCNTPADLAAIDAAFPHSTEEI